MGITHNRKLFSNFLSLSIVQGINFLIPLLITPYVISKVGVGGIGMIAVAQTVMIYLSTITDYGFNLTATKEISLYKADHSRISKIFFTVLASKIIIMIFLFALLVGLILFIPFFKHHFTLYIVGFTFVLGQALFVNWFFLGLEKMHFITIGSLVSRLIFVVLVFAFIKGKGDDVLFLFFLGIGNIVAALLSIFVAIHLLKLKFLRPVWADIIYEIKEGWQITLSILSLNTYLFSGIFILRFFTTDLVVGYYSIAVRIFFAARQVLAVFSEAVYPHLCKLILQSKETGNAFFKQIYVPLLIATLLSCTALFIFSPEIVYIFIKDGTELPVLLLRMLSFVPVVVCLNIPAYLLLLVFNRKKSYLKVFILATLINIIANILFVNQLGATGTVLSIIITELFIAAGLNRELYKSNLNGYISSGMI
ncbi:MAG: oligosaccharide flippase family protein [Ferruginibacter sp.]|nr:oligosaccharide flippase family protein [Ferruginibacter sp.]